MNIVNDVKYNNTDFIPAYGHDQVYKCSDVPYLDWKYSYNQTNDFTKIYKEEIADYADRFKKPFEILKIIYRFFYK